MIDELRDSTIRPAVKIPQVMSPSVVVSTQHRGTADGKPVCILFANVATKLASSEKWMDEQ
jgi:hypothetical protein